jgi:hypothetical protein
MLGTSSENVQVPGNSTIGSSSSNTSTFNAIPNFINGFKCASANAYNLVMGTATYVEGSCSNYGNSSIPSFIYSPQGYGSATYTFDQDVTNCTGCFINSNNGNFSMWYAFSNSTTSFELNYANMSQDTQTIPTNVVYMAFGISNIT